MPKTISNRVIIERVYKEFSGLYSKDVITEVVNDFFSNNGIRHFTRLKYTISLKHLGVFYYKDKEGEGKKEWAMKKLFKKK